MKKDISKLKKFFPISSQTSNEDKLVLLKIITFLKNKKKKGFYYLEIGSFLGGSLTPFLMEDKCKLVMSIDKRNQNLDDERNEKWNYQSVSENDMFNKIKNFKLSTKKLRTFNGDISNFKSRNKFDLVFIDGIHTDKNTFSDFICAHKLTKNDSIILFHDSSIIFKSITIIDILLQSQKIKFKTFKFQGSEITGIFFGRFSKINIDKEIYKIENFKKFCEFAQENLLMQQINNRIKIKFKLSRFLKKKFPYKLSLKKKTSKNSLDFHK